MSLNNSRRSETPLDKKSNSSYLGSTGQLSVNTKATSNFRKISPIKENSKVIVHVNCTDTIKQMDPDVKKRLIKAVIDLTDNPDPSAFRIREEMKNPDAIEPMKEVMGAVLLESMLKHMTSVVSTMKDDYEKSQGYCIQRLKRLFSRAGYEGYKVRK